MKVTFPVPNSETIGFFEIDFSKGIVVTDKPRGIIMYDEDCKSYDFYLTGIMGQTNMTEDSREDFVKELFRRYPDIKLEYFPDNYTRTNKGVKAI